MSLLQREESCIICLSSAGRRLCASGFNSVTNMIFFVLNETATLVEEILQGQNKTASLVVFDVCSS